MVDPELPKGGFHFSHTQLNFWACSVKYHNRRNFRHGLIFVNFGHTKNIEIYSAHAHAMPFAQARMTKLNPAGN